MYFTICSKFLSINKNKKPAKAGLYSLVNYAVMDCLNSLVV